MAQLVKNLPATQDILVRFLYWEDPLKEGMATYPSILTWRIPWTEEPSGGGEWGSGGVGSGGDCGGAEYNPQGCKESAATEHARRLE